LSGIFVTDGKNKQKKQKNICKTYTHPPHRRLRKKEIRAIESIQSAQTSAAMPPS